MPARVAGTWRLPQGELRLEQKFQMLTGTLTRGGNSIPIKDGRLRGEEISFTAGGTKYEGRVNDDAMSGKNGAWSATRLRSKPR
ncbi:hypothetical protein D3C83_19540 [compost metagenome]